MKQRILSGFRTISQPLLTVIFLGAFLIIAWFIVNRYSPGKISIFFVPVSTATPNAAPAITNTLTYDQGIKTYETVATSTIHSSEVALGIVRDVFISLAVVAAGSIAYLYKLAKDANDKAIEAVAAAQKAQSAAETSEKHAIEQYAQLENKILSLDVAIQARERGEITEAKLIESQQWHSWVKWKHLKDENGWQELKASKENGEQLTFAVHAAIESDLVEMRKRTSITEQSDDEKEYERRLRILLKKHKHQD